jgi:alpha-tubulin suppressor-like RCC1 family protein
MVHSARRPLTADRGPISALHHMGIETMLTRRENYAVAAWFASALMAALLAACSDDLTCAETATCPPQHDDTSKDASSEREGGLDVSSDDGPSGTDRRDVTAPDRSSDATLDSRTDASQTDTSQEDMRSVDQQTTDTSPNDAVADKSDSIRNSDVTSGVDTHDEPPGTGNDVSDAGTAPIDASVPSDVAPDAPNAPDVVVVTDAPTDITTVDTCTLNACGGCGPLGASPGAPCGQCGKYACAADKLSVVCDDPGYVKYKSVAVGGYRTCGLTMTGGVRCWGARGADADPVPPASDLLTDVQTISNGWWYSCAIRNNAGLRCWGSNISGQLGDGTTTDIWTTPTLDILSGVAAVATGEEHTCVLSLAGGVRCWGYNFFNQLGDGTSTERHTPPSSDVIGDIQAVATHLYYTCVLTKSGGVRCWGTFSGQYGNGAIATPPTTDFFSGAKAITTGIGHACALMTNGDVRCWGDNSIGQLGDGTTTNNPGPPTTAVLGNVKAVVAGRSHTCALMETGGVRCWGANVDGELGDGTTMNRSDALGAPEILTGVEMIASGGTTHTCALLNTGRIRCWGYNSYWQLGAGKVEYQTRPIDVQEVCP